MYRRNFLQGSTAIAALLGSRQVWSAGTASSISVGSAASLDQFIKSEMVARSIPGLSACLLHGDAILWQENYGFADLDKKIPITAEQIQNIASISKTFTMLAVMQQVEAGHLSLDTDVNEYLPFVLEHPGFPGQPITVRMMLQHRSALRDGQIYAEHYACGDPGLSLGEWVRQYFERGAKFYDPEEHFTPWAPGDKYEYSNTAFGVLAHLAEISSGTEFNEYCRKHIFSPLGMRNTGWSLADVDMSTHMVPYTWVTDGVPRTPSWGGIPLGPIRPTGPPHTGVLTDGYHENCAYSHPNYTDGFLRTSVNQLSTWARLWLGEGAVDGVRLLTPETVQQIFHGYRIPDGDSFVLQGLCLHSRHKLEGQELWGHGGGDPGVNTSLLMIREKNLAAIVFVNTNGVATEDFTIEMLRKGLAAV